MTNCPWIMKEEEVKDLLGIQKVALVNDFEAVGYGAVSLLQLEEKEEEEEEEKLISLQEGRRQPRQPLVVLGAGTGLGVAMAVWSDGDGRYKVVPGEGGHATFSPRGDEQRSLQRYVEEEVGYCEIESLLSGSGLERIYRWRRSRLRREEEEAEAMEAKDITRLALAGEDEDCLATVRLFLEIMGGVAGNLALTTLPSSGIYIAGGIVPKLIQVEEKEGYLVKSFGYAESRFSPLLQSFPLAVVKEECDAGLLGAAAYAEYL